MYVYVFSHVRMYVCEIVHLLCVYAYVYMYAYDMVIYVHVF